MVSESCLHIRKEIVNPFGDFLPTCEILEQALAFATELFRHP